MSQTMRAVKWWWGWEPEVLESWLEKKEAEGWHLFNMNAQIVFHFVKSEPKKIRYCADYQSTINPEYKTILQDAGWELVYKSVGWYIWRMEYTSDRPEIYTDAESLLGRYKRLMVILGVIAAMEVPSTISVISNTLSYTSDPGILVFIAMLYSFIGYCFYRLSSSSRRLKVKRKL